MNLFKIIDLDKSQQTDEVKKELYRLVQQFVWKYQRKLYPYYKGDITDLITDIYIQLLTPKSRVDGKEESFLDKYNPEVTSLAYLTKVAVQRMLIDRSRLDKREKSYTEKYDEESGDLSLDWLANKVNSPDLRVDEMEFTPEEVEDIKARYARLSPASKESFLQYYNEVKNVLTPTFKDLFKEVIGEDKPSNKRVRDLNFKRRIKLTNFPESEEFAKAFPDVVVSDSNYRGVPAIKVTVVSLDSIDAIKSWMDEHNYEFLGTYHTNNIYFKRYE